jgi:hypothetical protein
VREVPSIHVGRAWPVPLNRFRCLEVERIHMREVAARRECPRVPLVLGSSVD